jgi:hypothetical protein
MISECSINLFSDSYHCLTFRRWSDFWILLNYLHKDLIIIVAYKSDTFELCEGDERPLEKQRADPISSEGHEIVFPKGQIGAGESFDICVEVSGEFSDCKTLTNSPSKQTEEVTFSID